MGDLAKDSAPSQLKFLVTAAPQVESLAQELLYAAGMAKKNKGRKERRKEGSEEGRKERKKRGQMPSEKIPIRNLYYRD